MKFTLLTLAVLAAVVLVVYLMGRMLPLDHVASISGEIAAKPERVYGAITQLDKLTTWRSGLKKVEVESSGNRYVEHADWGVMPLKILERTPFSKFVTEIDDPSLGFGGTWTFNIEATPAGSRLTITEKGFVPNPLFRFLSFYVFGHQKNVRTYLEDLTRHLSS